jgi:hypothetical protein
MVAAPGWCFDGEMNEENATDRTTSSRITSASAEIAAGAADIFRLIAVPANQPAWDGNDNLSASEDHEQVRAVGEVFTMTLTSGGVRENRVVEFEQDHLIAWQPCEPGGGPLGQLWRWELDEIGPGRTRVTQTYDWTNLHGPQRRIERARATTSDRLAASIERLREAAEG